MTSRVQKGGPIFKPVAKSRVRPTTRPPNSSQSQTTAEVTRNSSSTSTFDQLFATPESTAPSHPFVEPRTGVPSPIAPSTTQEPQQEVAEHFTPTQSHRTTPAPPAIVPSRPAHSSSKPTRPSETPTPLPPASHTPVHASKGVMPSKTTAAAISLPSSSPGGQLTASTSGVSSESHSSTITATQASTKKSDGPFGGRKRKRASQVEGGLDEGVSDAEPKSRKVTPSKSRNSRTRSIPPFDADGDPGEEIDPTVMTMAAICSDTGHGRVSRKAAEIQSNHATWKAQNREKRARMRALMERKKYGRDEDEEDDPAPASSPPHLATPPSPVNPAGARASRDDSNAEGFDYTQDLSTSRYNVQIRIGPNGETVLDEESLVIDRTETENNEGYTHIVESDHTKFVNSGTYGKRYRGSRWSAEETERFYDALSQYGENYELIAYVLPGRDRKSCKNKFKAEDKKNKPRIEYCLRNSVPVALLTKLQDIGTLSRMTGKDFSGPVPEIQAPTNQSPPQPETPAVPPSTTSTEPFRAKRPKRKPSTTTPDDGLVIGSLE